MYEHYPFAYDPERHKDFKRASRHVISNSKHGKSLPVLTISKQEEELLRKGLAPFDMEDRWEGNLSDSKANANAKEVVVRLYRTWTSSLIYEARYRPQGQDNTLSLYEFAFESDKKVYHSAELEEELKQYQAVLRLLLDTISSRIGSKLSKKSN
ncbi:hypothetical protein P389DRAFT_192358 [Cystobasidium minutum MCA 4210]|uniref:uncharacterized protein n=1 Tax=Cystobasidium minutum MCA 4210 TaxID=1397322 RepID=UPI0034CD71E0|eukprot:jgi/Rhomi1/192358/gm1.572_g